MDKTVKQSLLCLSVVLVLLPLTHRKPGLPATLKADEPAYYLASLSLAYDGDLRCETQDLERAYQEFPYATVQNIILSTDDGWNTVYFGKPYIFPFLAAPFAALWKANGMVVFNSLLLVAMIWMGALTLRRTNSDALAALFSVGFFLVSTTYRYVYWLQPELLNMFATAGCLFFGLHVARLDRAGPRGAADEERIRGPRWLERLSVGRLTVDHAALIGSASILALGVYNKPMLAAMGLPVCFRLLLGRHWRGLGVWLLAAAAATGVLAGVSWGLTGHPTAYLGIDRLGYNFDTPHVMPMEPEQPKVLGPTTNGEAEPELGKETAGWWWIFNKPQVTFAELKEDTVYFFIGRHTGLFLYQPFALLALGLFAVFGRRSAVRWSVLGSLALLALFNLLFLSHNWHGGGGFVGNRYFLMAYPGFLFLVTRIRPDWIVVPGFAVGSVFVGSLLFSPHGLVVPSPTLQAHVRQPPFQVFPMEHSLVELPGYWGVSFESLFFRGRKDHLRPEHKDLWMAGGERAELWIQSLDPIDELVFDVSSPVPNNEVTLRIEGSEVRLIAGAEPQRIVLEPEQPTLVRYDRNRAEWSRILEIRLYRLEVETAKGEMPRWRDAGEQFFFRGSLLQLVEDSDLNDPVSPNLPE